MMNTSWMKGLALLLALYSANTYSTLISFDMVDGSSQGLLSYQNAFQSGFSSGQDAFKRFVAGDSVSDALLDDSLSTPSDSLGIVTTGFEGFFGITDTVNSDTSDVVSAQWQFDVSGYNNLSFAMNIAAMGDFEAADRLWLDYAIDGGPLMRLFDVYADESSVMSYPLASGLVQQYNDPMVITGAGLLVPAPLSNSWQTFSAELFGVGSNFTLSLSAITNGGTEGMAISDIKLFGDSVSSVSAGLPTPVNEPQTLALFVSFLLLVVCRRWQ